MRTHAVVRSLTKGRGIDHCTFYQCKVHLPHEEIALNWPIIGVKAHHTNIKVNEKLFLNNVYFLQSTHKNGPLFI